MRHWLSVGAGVALVALALRCVPAPSALAAQTTTAAIESYTTLVGADGGQPAANAAVLDQSGTQDDADRYITFIPDADEGYLGTQSFTLPAGIDPADILTLQVQINARGPSRSEQKWRWYIYDWQKGKWAKLGDNRSLIGGQWTLLTFTPKKDPARYIDPVTGQIQVRAESKKGLATMAVDYQAIVLTTPDPLPDPPPPDGAWWHPAPGTSWQWQLTGTIDTSFDVDMYDIDLFDTPQATIDALHTDGRIVICYFSAGSWENWRDDAGDFPSEVLGRTLDGWPDEKWLDIRQIDTLAPIMEARLDLAAAKDCDGVEPDNIDGYTNNSGFDLSYYDQLLYNTWLATEAHQRGLSIGLKNDLDQIPDLVAYFDWALNEQCFQYDECETLLPFVAAGKAVFGVEYEGSTASFCPQANAMDFDFLKKNLDLDAYRVACR